MNEDFWKSKIRAFFHDPPDKALILFHSPHEKRAEEILAELSLEYDRDFESADYIASAMQRLNIPKDYRMDDAKDCNNHICFKGPNKPVFKHTLSAAEENLQEIIDFIEKKGFEEALFMFGFNPEVIKEFFDNDDWKKTYFLLWRFLPEKYHVGYFLPADTRIPDHSIWDHLDVTAAIKSCLYWDSVSLFSLKIPAVQEFISYSRKLSDLWASSYIFSLLLYEAIKVIVNDLGPDVIIYPQLRDNPLFDHYLSHKLKVKGLERVYKEKLKIANLPNTFVCFVPTGKCQYYEKKCKEAIKDKWLSISCQLKKHLDKTGVLLDAELWDQQIKNAISVVVAYKKFFNLNEYKRIKDKLPKDIKDKQEKWLSLKEENYVNMGDFYFLTYTLLGTILSQASRLWDAWEESPITGRKCLMCGFRNAVVDKRDDKYFYWSGNKWVSLEGKSIDKSIENLLKDGERLCAVCLIKRFYKVVFKEDFNVTPPEFESVVEVAARKFIENIKKDNSFKRYFDHIEDIDIELIYKHEWESKEKQETTVKRLEKEVKDVNELKRSLEKIWEKEGEPNKYYAILMMDGDKIGKMLLGENLPNFGEFFHPFFKKKSEKWEKAEQLYKLKRVLTPSVHIAISRAMKDFSVYKVPQIVKEHKGFLVYSGGDDVLALFPADEVLDAALKLQESFKKDFYEIEVNDKSKKVMGLGKYVSMSAGIVFAHYRCPLYYVIEKARETEKKAKDYYKRDAFCITFIKRSGELVWGGGKWRFIKHFKPVIKALIDGKISNRFVYDFMDVVRFLEGDMLKAEVKRLLKRRKNENVADKEIEDIYSSICSLLKEYKEAYKEEYKEKVLLTEDIGKIIKMLFDAYKGD